MERREQQVAERSRKRGHLEREGQHIGSVECSIVLYREYVVLHDGERLEGHPDWEIRLARHTLNLRDLQEVPLVLELEDGRRFLGSLAGDRFLVSGTE